MVLKRLEKALGQLQYKGSSFEDYSGESRTNSMSMATHLNFLRPQAT